MKTKQQKKVSNNTPAAVKHQRLGVFVLSSIDIFLIIFLLFGLQFCLFFLRSERNRNYVFFLVYCAAYEILRVFFSLLAIYQCVSKWTERRSVARLQYLRVRQTHFDSFSYLPLAPITTPPPLPTPPQTASCFPLRRHYTVSGCWATCYVGKLRKNVILSVADIMLDGHSRFSSFTRNTGLSWIKQLKRYFIDKLKTRKIKNCNPIVCGFMDSFSLVCSIFTLAMVDRFSWSF